MTHVEHTPGLKLTKENLYVTHESNMSILEKRARRCRGCTVFDCVPSSSIPNMVSLLSGVPDLWDRNKIFSGGDLSHYQVPPCIRVFFCFVWFVVSDLGAFCNGYWPLCNTNELRGRFLNRTHQSHAPVIWHAVVIERFEFIRSYSLQWRHNERDCVSNHQPRDCVLNRLFRHRSKKTSRLRVTALCEGISHTKGQ